MQRLIERADQDKFRKAQERLAAAATGARNEPGMGPKPVRGRVAESEGRVDIATVLLAVVSVAAICAYRYAYVLTPLQKFYLTTYIRSGFEADRFQDWPLLAAKCYGPRRAAGWHSTKK